MLVCLLLLYSLEMFVFWVNNLKATSGFTIPLAEQPDGHLRTHSLLRLWQRCHPELSTDWWVLHFSLLSFQILKDFQNHRPATKQSLLYQQMLQGRSYSKRYASHRCIYVAVLHHLIKSLRLLIWCFCISSVLLIISYRKFHLNFLLYLYR